MRHTRRELDDTDEDGVGGADGCTGDNTGTIHEGGTDNMSNVMFTSEITRELDGGVSGGQASVTGYRWRRRARARILRAATMDWRTEGKCHI